ncbi:MAG TPA: glycosyltransferase family 4 protein [Bryobacteraceae bacterium]
MFILHIDTGEEMRGGQWQALHLMRGSVAAGHRVRLVAPGGSPLLLAAEEHQLDSRPLHLAALPAAMADIDLIHAHDARGHTLAVLQSKPAVVSRRVAFPVRRGALSQWKYRRVAHYIAVSEFVKRTLVEAGVDAGRISVVYDGVPLDFPSVSEDRSLVVALDSDDPGKGKKIVEQAAKLADMGVHFSSNLMRDLPRAALFVYITDLEGLGSAALFAMAAGAPVLASDVGGLPEVVEDGVTGLLTSNDPAEVAERMRRLLGDRPLATRLAGCAKKRVEAKFSIDRMVSGTLRVYERILA